MDGNDGKEIQYPDLVLGVLCTQAFYHSANLKCAYLDGMLDGILSPSLGALSS